MSIYALFCPFDIQGSQFATHLDHVKSILNDNMFHYQERERRRQHMILMRQLEGKKRIDDREKKREDLRVEKEKERDRRLEHRKIELEIMAESRKPLEDMSIAASAQKPMPELKRIQGVCLSGEAMANLLMVYEFLNNFGDTLGFDMDSLPSLDALQAGLLNEVDYEEELLSVVIHLVVCAIEDPGIPNPQKHLTLMGQNLRQADITNTNISEVLRMYFYARAQAEVRTIHGLAPPECYARTRNLESPEATTERVDEYNTHLFKVHSCLNYVKPRLPSTKHACGGHIKKIITQEIC